MPIYLNIRIHAHKDTHTALLASIAWKHEMAGVIGVEDEGYGKQSLYAYLW